MNFYTDSIDKLINCLSKLPTIGRKSATKMALKILEMDTQFAIEFANSILNMKKNVKKCKNCGNLTEEELCNCCLDKSRDKSKIVVVEDVTSVVSLEKSRTYRGLYHVLGGLMMPREDVSLKDLNVEKLIERVKSGEVNEIIFALSQTYDGQLTELSIIDLLKEFKDLKITKIANGIPLGGSVDTFDELTFLRAIEDRKDIEF